MLTLLMSPLLNSYVKTSIPRERRDNMIGPPPHNPLHSHDPFSFSLPLFQMAVLTNRGTRATSVIFLARIVFSPVLLIPIVQIAHPASADGRYNPVRGKGSDGIRERV